MGKLVFPVTMQHWAGFYRFIQLATVFTPVMIWIRSRQA